MSDTVHPGSGAAEEAGTQKKYERGDRGRFSKGNRGGPGNPFARRVAEMRKVVQNSVSDEDLTDVMSSLVEKAKDGEVSAARLVLSYSVGLPVPTVEPDRMDAQEVKVIQEHMTDLEGFMAPMHGIPADVVVQIHRVVVPAMGDEAIKIYRELLGLDGAGQGGQAPGKAAEAVGKTGAEKTTKQDQCGSDVGVEVRMDTTTEKVSVGADQRLSPLPNGYLAEGTAGGESVFGDGKTPAPGVVSEGTGVHLPCWG